MQFKNQYRNGLFYTFFGGTAGGTACFIPHFFGCNQESLIILVRINVCRGRDVGVTHESLGGPDINAHFLKVCAKGMPEIIRNKVVGQGIRRDQLVPVYPATHGNVQLPIKGLCQCSIRTLCIPVSVSVYEKRSKRILSFRDPSGQIWRDRNCPVGVVRLCSPDVEERDFVFLCDVSVFNPQGLGRPASATKHKQERQEAIVLADLEEVFSFVVGERSPGVFVAFWFNDVLRRVFPDHSVFLGFRKDKLEIL